MPEFLEADLACADTPLLLHDFALRLLSNTKRSRGGERLSRQLLGS